MNLLENAPKKKARHEIWQLFFTPGELEQLCARYEIIKGLTLENTTQRDLSAKLKLSIAKITRGSNELKRRSPELKEYLSDYFSKSEKKL
jgi:TrpR family transcriptional regulator, trp operon repressor